MPERKITVENTTEHPFDFALTGSGTGYGYVRVPAARMDPPVNNQVSSKRNGSAEVPELLLARLMREPVVRGWFEGRECVLVGTTVDALLALDLPPEPKPATGSPAQLTEENKRLQARIAELEAAARTGDSDKPAKGGK